MSDDRPLNNAGSDRPVNGGDPFPPQPNSADEIRRRVEERVAAEAAAGKDEVTFSGGSGGGAGGDGGGDDGGADGEKKWRIFVQECFRANELGDGVLFNALHRGRFLYVKSMETWLVWKDHCWGIDEMDEAKAAVENVVGEYQKMSDRVKAQIENLRGQEDADEKIKRLAKKDEAIVKRISSLRSMRRRANCLVAAHTCDEPLAIHGRELDQKPWLLPCANGVVDLKTGKLTDGRPEDYMMLACPTAYHGIDAPREAWEKALMEIFEDDDLVVSYMQRLMGMSAIGAVYENIFPVLTGPGGRNGKSTIVETISHVLGPLARPIRAEMLLDTYQMQSSAGPTPDIMSLRGLRFAWASETKEGSKVSANKVKWLTGGDRITGRNPHDKYETTFEPTHTLFLLSNFKPAADANDKAFWERVQNVPFNVRFLKNREPAAENERKADLFLKEKLFTEAPGILGWLVEGCLQWQMEGLKPPPKVVQETQDYMDDEDNYSAFVDHCLEKGEWLQINATELYDAFEAWWKRYVGRWVPKQKKFGKQMREFFDCQKTGGVYVYFGVALNEVWQKVMDGAGHNPGSGYG